MQNPIVFDNVPLGKLGRKILDAQARLVSGSDILKASHIAFAHWADLCIFIDLQPNLTIGMAVSDT